MKRKPEEVRRFWFVVFFSLSMILILGIWFISFDSNIKNFGNQPKLEEVKEEPGTFAIFKNGWQNLKNKISELAGEFFPSFWERIKSGSENLAYFLKNLPEKISKWNLSDRFLGYFKLIRAGLSGSIK